MDSMSPKITTWVRMLFTKKTYQIKKKAVNCWDFPKSPSENQYYLTTDKHSPEVKKVQVGQN
jgi:hypothetical protein